MNKISFQCTACEADFELEIAKIMARPGSIRCQNCDAKPPLRRAEGLAHGLEEIVSAMAAIRPHVRFELDLETAELPPPYGPVEINEEASLGSLEDEDEDDGDLGDDTDEDEDFKDFLDDDDNDDDDDDDDDF